MNRHSKLALAACACAVALASVKFNAAVAQNAPKATRVTVASAQNPSPATQVVTFTATVESVSPEAGVPTGDVEFFAGPASMGRAALVVNANGLATATINAQMGPGFYPVMARYYGDSDFAFSVSTPPLPQRVLGQ